MSSLLRIAFIGAGNANFGGGEGPWDHASRLGEIGGMSIVGIADTDTSLAERRLAVRRNSPAGGMYAETEIFADFRRMLDTAKPDAVFIALPPDAHGTAKAPKDIELTCAAAGVHMFIEKPVSAAEPEDVAPVADVLGYAAEDGLIVSVGYMFRYSLAVEKIKTILAETTSPVRAVIARYNCAYSEIASKVWWDVRRTGGPVVEQATHFCDLARYIAGEVDLHSVAAVGIAADEPAGELSDIPAGPDGEAIDADIPPEFRIPRATAAVWRFTSGAVGSLTHGVLLHRKKYLSELEVWGDGLRIVLADPYSQCRLHVRRPHSEETETLDFAGDDPYMSEAKTFIHAVSAGDASAIRCTYADAAKTHQLTWAIRRATEKGDDRRSTPNARHSCGTGGDC